MRVGEPFSSFRVFTGIFIPDALVSYKGISAAEKLCLGRLYKYCGKATECWPSQEELSEELGVDVRTVGRHIEGLAKDGFIRIIQRGLGQSNKYQVLWHQVFDSTDFLTGQDCPIKKGQLGGGEEITDPTRLSGQYETELSDPSIEVKRVIEESHSDGFLSAGTFVIKSRRLPGKKYSGKQAKRIPELWQPEWSEMTFEEVMPLVDQALNKTPMRSAVRSEREPRPTFTPRRPEPAREPAPPETALAISWQSDPRYGHYLFELARTGKRVKATDAKSGFDIWQRLTEKQKDACIEDIKYLVRNVSESKFVPNPSAHLAEEPWNNLRMPEEQKKIPWEKMDNNQKAWELARQRGLTSR